MTERAEYRRKYYLEHKERALLLGSIWKNKNREKIREREKGKYSRLTDDQKQKQCERVRKYRKTYKRNRSKEWDNRNFGGNRINALERDNYTCQKCYRRIFEVKRMCVHHIDGKGRNSEIQNNNMSNLITLCAKCHITLHHQKGEINGKKDS